MTTPPFPDAIAYLPSPDTWHPEAVARLEDVRAQLLEQLDDEISALEVWGTMGSCTVATLSKRARQSNQLVELLREDEVRPGWEAIARGLVRLASAEIPGAFLAGLVLLDLVTQSRRADRPSVSFDLAWIDDWADPCRRLLRDAIRARLARPEGPASQRELFDDDDLHDHVWRHERDRFGEG